MAQYFQGITVPQKASLTIINTGFIAVFQPWALLDQDLDDTENCVNDAVKVVLNQNQFDALISFVFNVGKGAFLGSTLLNVLNQEKYDEVPTQLGRWNKDNGHVVKGLTNRREKEIALWNTPI